MKVKNGTARSTSFDIVPKMRSGRAWRRGQERVMVSGARGASSTARKKNSRPFAASAKATG